MFASLVQLGHRAGVGMFAGLAQLGHRAGVGPADMFAGLAQLGHRAGVGPADMFAGLAQLGHRARASGRQTCSPVSRSSGRHVRRAARPPRDAPRTTVRRSWRRARLTAVARPGASGGSDTGGDITGLPIMDSDDSATPRKVELPLPPSIDNKPPDQPPRILAGP